MKACILGILSYIVLLPSILYANQKPPQPSLKKIAEASLAETEEKEINQELDNLAGVTTSLKLGVNTKTLRTIDNQGNNLLKATIVASRAMKDAAQQLRSTGTVVIQKACMGGGFLIGLVALILFLDRHGQSDKKSSAPIASALISGVVALGCGYFLMH